MERAAAAAAVGASQSCSSVRQRKPCDLSGQLDYSLATCLEAYAGSHCSVMWHEQRLMWTPAHACVLPLDNHLSCRLIQRAPRRAPRLQESVLSAARAGPVPCATWQRTQPLHSMPSTEVPGLVPTLGRAMAAQATWRAHTTHGTRLSVEMWSGWHGQPMTHFSGE